MGGLKPGWPTERDTTPNDGSSLFIAPSVDYVTIMDCDFGVPTARLTCAQGCAITTPALPEKSRGDS